MKKDIIKYMEEKLNIKYSKEQRDILETKGGIQILASAGSGKTTILTHLLAKRVLSGEIVNQKEVVCTTFSKAGATELQERLENIFKQLGLVCQIRIKTMHSLYYQILASFNVIGDFKVLDDNETVEVMVKAIEKSNENEEYQKIPATKANAIGINSVFGYVIDNRLNTSMLEDDVDITIDKFTNIVDIFTKIKAQNHYLTFDDMQQAVHHLLLGSKTSPKNNSVLTYCKAYFKDFYIDEFQDTSIIQYEIIKAIIKNPRHLTVIGDDDQCIYRWRGAKPEILVNITKDYDLTQKFLSTNYRCKSQIVNFVKNNIWNVRDCVKKPLHSFTKGGNVHFVDYGVSDNVYDIAKNIVAEIKKLKQNGVSLNDIAVLNTKNAELGLLKILLGVEEITTKSNTRIGITQLPCYKRIKEILWFSLDVASLDNYKFIMHSIFNISVANTNTLINIKEKYNIKYKTLLEQILSTCSDIKCINPIALTYNENKEIEKMLKENKEEIYNFYGCFLAKNWQETFYMLCRIYSLYVQDIDGTISKRIYNGLVKLYSEIISKADIYSNKKELIDSLNDTILYYESFEKRSPSENENVTLSTIHNAKGKEWEKVFIFDDSNKCFPDLSVVDVYDKDFDISLASSNFRYLDDIRRLHYVALTRAKNDLYICCNLKRPSWFLYECVKIRPYNEEKVINFWGSKGYGGFLINNVPNCAIVADLCLHKGTLFSDYVSNEYDIITNEIICASDSDEEYQYINNIEKHLKKSGVPNFITIIANNNGNEYNSELIDLEKENVKEVKAKICEQNDETNPIIVQGYTDEEFEKELEDVNSIFNNLI